MSMAIRTPASQRTSPCNEAEAGIDVLGEGPEEAVDDAGAAHGSATVRLGVGGRAPAETRQWPAAGEEPPPVLSPGRFAGRIVFCRHAELLAAGELPRERIGRCRSQRRRRDRLGSELVVPEMHGRGDDRRGNGQETDARSTVRSLIERRASVEHLTVCGLIARAVVEEAA